MVWKIRPLAALCFAGAALLSGDAQAGPGMSGTQHSIVGGGFSSAAAAPQTSGAHRSGLALGQPEALGLSGTGTDLGTNAPGFWPIVAGALPTLDVDADALPNYLDPDDDGDGLADTVESGTGVFVDPQDTGTDPLDPDSDGDGVDDGTEVSLGTDPNQPGAVAVPALQGLPGVALAALIALLGAVWLSRRRFASTDGNST